MVWRWTPVSSPVSRKGPRHNSSKTILIFQYYNCCAYTVVKNKHYYILVYSVHRPHLFRKQGTWHLRHALETEGKQVLLRLIVISYEMGSTMATPNAKSWVRRGQPSSWLQDSIAPEDKQFSLFVGIRKMCCTSSCLNSLRVWKE